MLRRNRSRSGVPVMANKSTAEALQVTCHRCGCGWPSSTCPGCVVYRPVHHTPTAAAPGGAAKSAGLEARND